MRTGVIVEVSATDRKRLAAIVADRNAPQKHVWRARIVLLTADGCGTAEIMRRTGTSKTAVWRWQERFMTDGVKGLLCDKTRPSRIPPLAGAVEQSVVARTLADPPGETTHWTAAAMAQERQELPLPISARILVSPLPLIAAVAREADEPTVFPRSMRVVLGVLSSSYRRPGRLARRQHLS